MKCIKCGGDFPTPPQSTANLYREWCDLCFFNAPLSERYPKTTPEELAQMLAQRAQDEARLAAKKAAKRAARAATDANNGKAKKGKNKDVDGFQNGDESLFDYQDKD